VEEQAEGFHQIIPVVLSFLKPWPHGSRRR
jgi:hypothetical protein